MAAHRIRSSNNNAVLPRCRSEGALIDFSEGVSETTLTNVKGFLSYFHLTITILLTSSTPLIHFFFLTVPSPSALRLDTIASFGAAREVIAIKDYCPSSFTTLKFSKGDCLYVIDTSGGEWWYAHNSKEMGYIPAAYVQPINYRDSTFSDSGMIDSQSDISEGVKEMDISGEWTGSAKTTESRNDNPFVNKRISTNPFLNGTLQGTPDQNSNQNSAKALCFGNLSPPISNTSSNININGFESGLCDTKRISYCSGTGPNFRRDDPFFRSKRCYSMSELSVLQSLSDGNQGSLSFFGGMKSPKPEHYQSREDFKSAWLNHRKLTRSCHDLDSVEQNPGWGQTQPIETNIVCNLDSSGGAVELPNTSISIHIPEGHVAPGETQQISLKALLDPPLELNNDRCTTVSPVVEVKLSNMETKTPVTLEMKVSVVVKIESRKTTEVVCVRSDFKEGPYVPISRVYMYGDTVQVTLDNLEPCMYVSVVAQAQTVAPNKTVWEHVVKKVTLGVYGPKHIHPSFKTVVAIFGHDCAPKTLLVSDAKKYSQTTPPVVLQLWGKHQFVQAKPQDIQVGVFSNMSNFEVRANEQARTVRGFQIKLGKVARLIYMIAARDSTDISDFTLRIQVKDDKDCILAQFCVQTPTPPPKTSTRSSVQRRFLKKKEVNKIILSPLAATTKYPVFQDRLVKNQKFAKFLKTVVRQSISLYLLEYLKGDVVALLSEEKIKLKGHLWTKEWYIGYYHGRIGLVHAKNILIMGKVKPVNFKGPDLTTIILLEQLLKPCMCLTYIYASVRTILMENVASWRVFADALGYVNLPLTHFCRTEAESEPEKVASVLEKLKEDCNGAEGKERKSFQKELMKVSSYMEGIYNVIGGFLKTDKPIIIFHKMAGN